MNFNGNNLVTLAHSVHHILVGSGEHLSENGVLAVEPLGGHMGDEELGTIGTLPRPGAAGVSHSQQAGLGELQVGATLVIKLVAGATAAGALRVATLNHEICNHTVESQTIIEALAGQVQEAGGGHGSLGSEHREVDIALAGLHRDLLISSHARHHTTHPHKNQGQKHHYAAFHAHRLATRANIWYNPGMPRIALIQQEAVADPAENKRRQMLAIREAAAGGAQIVCTQEMCTTLYFCRTQDCELFNTADPVPGVWTNELCELAKELGVVIVAAGFEKRATGLYHNTAWVIDADGTFLGLYRKMHIPQDPGFEEKFYFTPGDLGYKCFETRFGRIGVLICWDQWYPEAARLTAMEGAEILFYPTAIGWIPGEEELYTAQHCAWETVQRGHAVANGCYVCAVNRCGVEGETTFWGQSFVADYCGQIVAKAPVENRTILYADVNLAALEAHRRIWPFFRDRRIDSYSGITRRWGK